MIIEYTYNIAHYTKTGKPTKKNPHMEKPNKCTEYTTRHCGRKPASLDGSAACGVPVKCLWSCHTANIQSS